MENLKAKELFESQFKFSLNQEVRHKGDSKHSFNADMGLLIIGRFLKESMDDDENYNYIRFYECRMIRFSGSGDVQHFKEMELLTMDEYTKKCVEEEAHREEARNIMHQTKNEIFASFGVQRGTEVYLKNEKGEIDKTKIWRVSGFSANEERATLHLQIEAGMNKGRETAEVKDNSEFEIKQ